MTKKLGLGTTSASDSGIKVQLQFTLVPGVAERHLGAQAEVVMLMRITEFNTALVLEQIFFFLPLKNSFRVFWNVKFVSAGKFLNPRFPCTTHQSRCPLLDSPKSCLLAISNFFCVQRP